MAIKFHDVAQLAKGAMTYDQLARKLALNLKGICASNEGAAIGRSVSIKETGSKVVKDEKLPKVTGTGYYWYDKSNMTDPKVAAVFYD